MNPRTLLSVTAGIAFVVIAASVAYFLLVHIPQHDRELAKAAEEARAQMDARSEAECSAQARESVSRFLSDERRLVEGGQFIGSENHYSRQLRRCFVSIEEMGSTAQGSYFWTRTIVDAYENSAVLSCFDWVGQDRSCWNGTGELTDEEATRLSKEYMGHE